MAIKTITNVTYYANGQPSSFTYSDGSIVYFNENGGVTTAPTIQTTQTTQTQPTTSQQQTQQTTQQTTQPSEPTGTFSTRADGATVYKNPTTGKSLAILTTIPNWQTTWTNSLPALVKAGTISDSDAQAIAKQMGLSYTTTAPQTNQTTQTAGNAGSASLDPYGTGRIYNYNVDPSKGHYVYNKEGNLSWYDPANPPADLPPQTQQNATIDLQARRDKAYQIIDSSNLPDELKQIYKSVINVYPPGVEESPTEIINAFNTIKNTTIDPHYAELAKTFAQTITDQYSSLLRSRGLQKEAEELQAKQAIETAKGNLESSGRTFTGEALKQLGTQSAFAQPGDTSQVPIGGTMEGEIPQQLRGIASSSEATYQQNLLNLGRQAETQLGSGSNLIPGYQKIGGITGTLETQKQGEYGSTLQDILAQYNQKQQNLTNI